MSPSARPTGTWDRRLPSRLVLAPADEKSTTGLAPFHIDRLGEGANRQREGKLDPLAEPHLDVVTLGRPEPVQLDADRVRPGGQVRGEEAAGSVRDMGARALSGGEGHRGALKGRSRLVGHAPRHRARGRLLRPAPAGPRESESRRSDPKPAPHRICLGHRKALHPPALDRRNQRLTCHRVSQDVARNSL